MDASYKIQRGIHVHLIQFFMCPEFWVHIIKHPLFSRLIHQYFARSMMFVGYKVFYYYISDNYGYY